MSYTLFCRLISLLIVCAWTNIFGMVYDYRYIPLFPSPRILINELQQRITFDGFVATGNKATGFTDTPIGIPEISGSFNLHELSEALNTLGLPNPLPPDAQIETFPYRVTGKLQAQGINGLMHIAFNKYLSCGGSWLLMRINNTQTFIVDNSKCTLYTPTQLDEYRRTILSELGFVGPNYNAVGFGDAECYVRLGSYWEYIAKCRFVDLGARLGFLIPAGMKRNIAFPSSISLGDDGMWGVYAALDGLFEVKEDIKVSMLFRLNQRFSRIITERLPIKGEPYIFGATCGPIKVDPGCTFIWSPTVILENLRKGLGIGVQYHLIYHQQDTITDKRPNKTVPVNLSEMQKFSKWGEDYVTVDVFYDFGKELRQRSFAPVLSLRIDIPAYFYVSEYVPQTYRISLGLEYNF